jgi:hypothetical protein
MSEINRRVEHLPRKVGEAITTPQKFHKERHEKGVDYYEEVGYTSAGEAVYKGHLVREKISISRATCNFAGAYPYLFDVISYACIHAKAYIEDVYNYYSIIMTYDKFLDFALDGMNEQTEYLQNELFRMSGLDRAGKDKTPYKIIAVDEKNSLFAQPVIISVGKGERELSEKGQRGAKQLGKETNGTVQILFLKCLFKDLVETDTRYINYPKAFFAKLRQTESLIQAILPAETSFPPETSFPQTGEPDAGTRVPAPLKPPSIDAGMLYKIFTYIKLHDNSESEMIRLKTIETLKHCAPELVQTVKGKDGSEADYLKNAEASKRFMGELARAIKAMNQSGLFHDIDIKRIQNAESGDIQIFYERRREEKE